MILCSLLTQAATLSGVVNDVNGQPVAEISVYAYTLTGTSFRTETAADGSWLLEDLPEDQQFRVRAVPPDASGAPNVVERYYPDAWEFCDSEKVAGGTSDLLMSLPEGGQITGKILTPEGTPLAGAYVVCAGMSSRYAQVGGVGLTDENGDFLVSGLDADPNNDTYHGCEVYDSDYPTQYFGPTYDVVDNDYVAVRPGQTTDAGTHTLLPGIQVSGTIWGPDDVVPPGGAVYVYASSQVVGVPVGEDGR